MMTSRLQQAVEDARDGMAFYSGSFVPGSPLFTGRSLSAEEVEAASSYIKEHPDISSYHLLMILRELSSSTYAGIPDATKAKVLCDALARLREFNDFGHLYTDPVSLDGVAAKALLEIGEPALGCLRKLLLNKDRVRHFGSDGAITSSIYEYRRADFAYRYIMLILGRTPVLLDELKERDKLIADLLKELKDQP